MNVLIGVPISGVPIPASGPAYIAASLKSAGHAVRGWTWGQTGIEAGIQWCDVFMTGGLSCHWKQIEAMIHYARQHGKPTVLGGGIVSAEVELVTQALWPTYSIIGQGEITAVELMEVFASRRDWTTVDGLAMLTVSGVRRTNPRTDIQNLDALSFPDYETFLGPEWPQGRPSDMDYLSLWDAPREYPLVASRSCPFHCTFCWHTSGDKYRRRSVENIMAEIRQVTERHDITVFSIIDELFGCSPAWLQDFCRAMCLLQNELRRRIHWWAALRAPQAEPDLLAMMRAAGCYMVSYGFESYSAAVLNSMQKRIKPADIDKAIRLTREAGLAIMGQFIFGDPAETPDTVQETLAYWRQVKSQVFTGMIWVCPNSPNYQLAVRRGVISNRLAHQKDIYRLINVTAMSNAQYKRLALRIEKLNALEDCWPASRMIADTLFVRCPHCRENLTYERFVMPPLEKRRLICRRCRQRFQVSTWYYRVLLQIIARLLPDYAWLYSLTTSIRHCLNLGQRYTIIHP